MPRFDLYTQEFKGQRDDKSPRFISKDFLAKAENVNFDDNLGFNKILAPTLINSSELSANNDIDGVFEYSYLDANNSLQSKTIVFTGGNLYSLLYGTGTLIKSGLEQGKAKHAVYQDKLLIANGKQYVKVYNGQNNTVYDLGAAEAVLSNDAGVLVGDYYYEVTFITAGGEERTGVKSNTLTASGKQVTLNLPIGYAGTTSRRIYRTEAGGGSPKLVTTIGDNSTLAYTDNTADSALTNTIPNINNESPKPYFIQVTNENKLLATVDDKYPTQGWASDVGEEILDLADYFDISNRGNDNTPVKGIALDYDVSIAVTEKQVYIIDTSSDAATIRPTRANVGCKDGYTMASVPANEAYPGGVKFVSSDNTVRLFNGNFAAPIATSLDNLKTDNWGQAIQGSLEEDLKSNSGMYAFYYDFKYHLAVNEKIYVFDIRNQQWSYLKIATSSYNSYCNVLAEISGSLYSGQKYASFVEELYTDGAYRGENLSAKVQFPMWAYSETLKHFEEFHIYYTKGNDFTVNLTLHIPGDELGDISQTLTFTSSGAFSDDDFDSDNFETENEDEDYIVIYLNRYGRGFQIKELTTTGTPSLRAFRLTGRTLTNKEKIKW